MARSTRGSGSVATRGSAKPDPHAKTDCAECAKKTLTMNAGGWCDRCGLMAGHMKSCSKHRAHNPKSGAAAAEPAKGACVQCGSGKGKPHAADCPNAPCSECESMVGHLLTCTRHPNYRAVTLDGKTGAVLETDVDGKAARIDTTSRPKRTRSKKAADDGAEVEEPQGLKRVAPPIVKDPALFEALQYAVDKKIIFGVKQALTTYKLCDEEWFDAASDQSVGCSALAMFDFETLDTCQQCKHTKKKVIKIQCISHMALRINGELKDRQTNMFDEVGDDA